MSGFNAYVCIARRECLEVGVRNTSVLKLLCKNVVTAIASHVTYNLLVLRLAELSCVLVQRTCILTKILIVVLTSHLQAQNSFHHYLLHIQSCPDTLVTLYIFWGHLFKKVFRDRYKNIVFLRHINVWSCITNLYVLSGHHMVHKLLNIYIHSHKLDFIVGIRTLAWISVVESLHKWVKVITMITTQIDFQNKNLIKESFLILINHFKNYSYNSAINLQAILK